MDLAHYTTLLIGPAVEEHVQTLSKTLSVK